MSFNVDSSYWTLKKMEYYEYNSGSPLEIDIYCTSPVDMSESSHYWERPLSLISPIEKDTRRDYIHESEMIEKNYIKPESLEPLTKREKEILKKEELYNTFQKERKHKERQNIKTQKQEKLNEEVELAQRRMVYIADKEGVSKEAQKEMHWIYQVADIIKTKHGRNRIELKYRELLAKEFNED